MRGISRLEQGETQNTGNSSRGETRMSGVTVFAVIILAVASIAPSADFLGDSARQCRGWALNAEWLTGQARFSRQLFPPLLKAWERIDASTHLHEKSHELALNPPRSCVQVVNKCLLYTLAETLNVISLHSRIAQLLLGFAVAAFAHHQYPHKYPASW